MGHSIDGLTITDNDASFGKGLFTTISGSVRNLALTHVDISGNGAFYGTLASTLNDGATISNIIVEGSIKGTHEYGNYGGLVSQVMGESIIDNSNK